MRIVAENHALDHRGVDARRSAIRQSLALDHIGDELRGVYGHVNHETLPEALSALAALLDRGAERGDSAPGS